MTPEALKKAVKSVSKVPKRAKAVGQEGCEESEEVDGQEGFEEVRAIPRNGPIPASLQQAQAQRSCQQCSYRFALRTRRADPLRALWSTLHASASP